MFEPQIISFAMVRVSVKKIHFHHQEHYNTKPRQNGMSPLFTLLNKNIGLITILQKKKFGYHFHMDWFTADILKF